MKKESKKGRTGYLSAGFTDGRSRCVVCKIWGKTYRGGGRKKFREEDMQKTSF